MLQVGPAVQAHAHERRLPHRLRQRSQMASELASVKGLGMNRSALLGAAWMIGVIVRVIFAEVEFYLGVRLEEADHGAGVLQERGNARFVEMVSRLMRDIGFRIFKRVVDAGARCERIARYPQPSSRSCGGSAKGGCFLHHKAVGAKMMCRDRRRQPGRAGANDQHVAGDGFHLLSLPERNFSWLLRSTHPAS